LMPPDRVHEEEQILNRLRAGERIEHFETERVTRDGRSITVSVSISPLRDAEGNVIGASKVVHDITNRKRAQDELLRAKESAENANRAKDQFLAVLSHELRTPLTPVVMGMSMLQSRQDLDPAVRETLEMMHRNVEMEARLLDDLLDVNRIACGKIELNRSTIDLNTVIQQAVEVCKPDLEDKVHFGMDMGSDGPYWVEADVPRLQQVFWNILKNAIKFTPNDGCIGIRCYRDGGNVLAEVTDTGIGIEPEALSRVFIAFEQGERSITRQFGGLGLGLAICRALVEMHDGEIKAESGGRAKGSRFSIRLPLTVPAAKPTMSNNQPIEHPSLRPLKILLVEDHSVTASMIKQVLMAEGHKIEIASGVVNALELAAKGHFDLLLSDLSLPDGNGHNLMKALRGLGLNLPGIALSGYGQEEEIRHSYEAGFAAHLIKPASREKLLDAIAFSISPAVH